MAVFLRSLEACLLASVGVFMAAFALSDAYWQLLNPKYSWLTFVAGVIVLLVGGAGFFHVGRRPRLTESLSIAVFLCLALVATMAPNSLVGETGEEELIPRNGGGYVGGSLTLHYEDEAVPLPVVTFEGETFTRINLAELLAGEDGGWVEPGGRYAVQGAVIRTPEMDAAGYVGLGRLFIYCCFADAVGVVALVKVDNPEEFRAGSWVRALGILRKGAPFPGLALRMTGSLSTARSERFVLHGIDVEKAPMVGVPFILGIKEESPFEY